MLAVVGVLVVLVLDDVVVVFVVFQYICLLLFVFL